MILLLNKLSINNAQSNNIRKHRFQSISEKSKVLASQNESINSGFIGGNQLDESIIPPQIFDNSAVLFSNSKRKKANRGNVINHLQSDAGKSDNEVGYKSANENGNLSCFYKSQWEGEGEEEWEGESYSSSWSWSSWLREKNADNGMSLKLSQFTYVPSYSGYQQNSQSDNKSYAAQSFYKDDETSWNNKFNENSKVDVDFSNEYPDNLNNGKFKLQRVA